MGESEVPGRGPRFLAENRWVILAVALGVVFSACVLLWPARGLTFLWDDFSLLGRLARTPRPAAWIQPFNQHWIPLFLLLLDMEHQLFAGDHTGYLVVAWVIHGANLALLGALLRARTGDDRAAGLATAAFGVATTYRVVLWWMTTSSLALCFFWTTLAFLAFDRYRTLGRTPWLVVGLASTFLCPLSFGSGISLAPILALEEWLTGPRDRRARTTALILAVWAVSCGLHLGFAGSEAHDALPRTASDLGLVARFSVEMLGLGFVHQVPLVPLDPTHGLGVALALAYVSLLPLLLLRLDRADRMRVLVAHAYLVLVFVPIALVRWSRFDHPGSPGFGGQPLPLTAISQYQYLPGIVWTTTLAVALKRALERAPRATVAGSLLVLLALAIGHGRAAHEDRGWLAPRTRKLLRSAELVELIVGVAREAKTPVYDSPLPDNLAWPDTRLRDVVAIVSPGIGSWTDVKTKDSTAPLRGTHLMRSALHLGDD